MRFVRLAELLTRDTLHALAVRNAEELLRLATIGVEDQDLDGAKSDKDRKTDMSEEEWEKAFHAFDTDGSGSLDTHEIKDFLRQAHYGKLSGPELDAEVKNFMANFDDDGDAEVTWEEFRDALKNIASQKLSLIHI